jgi:isopentenyldiphosphate isomerase
MSATEYLPVCDEHDRVVGRAPREVIHGQQLRHRAVHIVVRNARGEIFMQRRGPGKDTFPGAWDTSAGGHVAPGEDYAGAARRELAEELGLDGEPHPVGEHLPCSDTGMEFVRVFELLTHDSPRWDGVEVTDGRWMTPQAILAETASGSLVTTPAFRRTFELWRRAQG